MDKLNIYNLDAIVDASVSGWHIFIKTGITSVFYQNVSQYYNTELAAKLTLMHLYLNTFSPSEKDKLIGDTDYFLNYADGFMRELLPHGKRDVVFISASKHVFSKAMRKLLSRDKDELPREIPYINRRDFMRGAMQLTSSVDELINCWDIYKEFLFRIEPQGRHRPISILNIA